MEFVMSRHDAIKICPFRNFESTVRSHVWLTTRRYFFRDKTVIYECCIALSLELQNKHETDVSYKDER